MFFTGFFILSVAVLVHGRRPPSSLRPSELFSCGNDHSVIQFAGGHIVNDPVALPSQTRVIFNVTLRKPLRTNLKMKMMLYKLEPFRMPVPCWSKFGSCTYNVCQLINKHKDVLCPSVNGERDCACPIPAGTYRNAEFDIALPRFMKLLATILQGNYDGDLTFYNDDTKKIYGCVGMKIGVVARG
ncbi:uncharacterized protein LOC135401691 [Ornithodoros turicata]